MSALTEPLRLELRYLARWRRGSLPPVLLHRILKPRGMPTLGLDLELALRRELALPSADRRGPRASRAAAGDGCRG